MGLVLGGGGARGCYEIGAWQAFRENGIRFDVVAGTSIGALVGAIYTQQTLHPLVEFVEHLKPTHIAEDLFSFPESFSQLIRERGQIEEFLKTYIFSGKGMDVSPLKEAIDKMFDYPRFKASDIDFACMTFNVTRRRPEAYFKSEMTEENARDIILASASCYPAFPMLEMNGQYYIDGGYWSNLPVSLALDMKAEKILVIDVEGPGIIQPMPRRKDILVMKPMLPLGNFLDFSREQGVQSMRIGYLETCKMLDVFVGYLFTFTKADLDDMYFMDAYLRFMFDLHHDSLKAQTMEKMIHSLCGFHSSSLTRREPLAHGYGRLVEALAYAVGIPADRLYGYHHFILELLSRLDGIRIESLSDSIPDSLEKLKQLSKTDLMALLHHLIVKNDGQEDDALRVVKRVFATEYYLALAWYFLDLVYCRFKSV